MKLHITIGLIGSAAVAAQVLLIREIVNLFSGNELLYGLAIFLWLLLYAIGSGWLGRAVKWTQDKEKVFYLLQSMIALLLPLEIFFARVSRELFGLPFGANPELPAVIYIITIILAPVTLALGFQFALSSALLSELFNKDTSQISLVYIFEAVGAILGGVLLTYYLIFVLNPFQIAAVLGALIAVSLIVIDRKSSKTAGRLLLAVFIIIFALSSLIDLMASRLSFSGYNLVESADSPYGRISITEDRGEYNFFENGSLFFSTADRVNNEEITHLPMLMHPAPKDVLLIGGGVSGAANELLKYKLNSLDYVELDQKIIELAGKFIQLDPKINIIGMDGIKFIRETDRQYDLIIVNLPDPLTAMLNRYYTLEFFQACRERLLKNGILCVTLNTSHAYMGRVLKLLNRSVYKTFSGVFKHTAVIPGNVNYFFGSESYINDNRYTLRARWSRRNIPTEFFKSDTLVFILWPDKIKYISDALDFDDATPVNTALRPITYYLGTLFWTSHFPGPLKNLFYGLMRVGFYPFIALLAAALIALKYLSIKFKQIRLPAVITLLGFTGMSVQLVLIYTFQSLFGYVYQTIGLFTAFFMAGLLLGSCLTHYLSGRTSNRAALLKFDIFFLLLILALVYYYLNAFPLPLASLLVSLPVGAAFPLAVKLHEKERPEIGSLAGILYGSDLLGGGLAAIATTVFFIPLFGIWAALSIAFIFGAAALVMIYS